MKIVYISHPIKGDKAGNIEKIIKIVRSINLFLPDIVPLTNYIADCLALNDDVKEERDKGLSNDEAILQSGIVDELWVFGNEISDGMRIEIDVAQKIGIPVRYFANQDFIKKEKGGSNAF